MRREQSRSCSRSFSDIHWFIHLIICLFVCLHWRLYFIYQLHRMQFILELCVHTREHTRAHLYIWYSLLCYSIMQLFAVNCAPLFIQIKQMLQSWRVGKGVSRTVWQDRLNRNTHREYSEYRLVLINTQNSIRNFCQLISMKWAFLSPRDEFQKKIGNLLWRMIIKWMLHLS